MLTERIVPFFRKFFKCSADLNFLRETGNSNSQRKRKKPCFSLRLGAKKKGCVLMIKTKILSLILCAVLALLLTGCNAGNTVSRVTSKAGDTISKAGEDLSKAEDKMESDGRTDSDLDTSSDRDTIRDDSAIDDNNGILSSDGDRNDTDSEWVDTDPGSSADYDTSSDLS